LDNLFVKFGVGIWAESKKAPTRVIVAMLGILIQAMTAPTMQAMEKGRKAKETIENKKD
jgi:hypothetical protein